MAANYGQGSGECLGRLLMRMELIHLRIGRFLEIGRKRGAECNSGVYNAQMMDGSQMYHSISTYRRFSSILGLK